MRLMLSAIGLGLCCFGSFVLAEKVQLGGDELTGGIPGKGPLTMEQVTNEREISVRYLLRGTRPSGALHKRYLTLFSRPILTKWLSDPANHQERNVALTAPYMHDGSQKTLREVVQWYVQGGHANPYLSDKIKKFDASEQEIADLIAFMESLNGSLPSVEQGRLPK